MVAASSAASECAVVTVTTARSNVEGIFGDAFVPNLTDVGGPSRLRISGHCYANLGIDRDRAADDLMSEKNGGRWENHEDQRWHHHAALNGFFANAEIEAYLALLEREKHHQQDCLFVTLPDVVGSARRTLEVFERWKDRSELAGWKIALVCQDGQEHLPIPWDEIAAVFIGGSTNWKCGEDAAHIIKAAKALGIWGSCRARQWSGTMDPF